MKTKMKSIATFLALTTLSLSSFANLADVIDCRQSEEQDMKMVANYIDDNWNDYERFMERETGLDFGGCMENRFKDNGKVKCEADNGGSCNNSNAWAMFGSHKIHMCPSFLNRISSFGNINRRACISAIMSHEFAHTCFRGEGGAERIDNAAFDYWASTHNVTISLSDCGTL